MRRAGAQSVILFLIVSSAAIAGDIQTAMKRVEALRHQTFRRTVAQKTISRADLVAFLQERLKSDLPLPPERYVDVLRAFQVIPMSGDPLGQLLDLYEAQVLAFYDPRTATYYSLSTPPEGLELNGAFDDAVQVHELTHALQDQVFNIGPRLDKLREQWDGQLAYQSLLEGEATLVMLADLAGSMGVSLDAMVNEPTVVQMLATMSEMKTGMPEGTPPYFSESLTFPYAEGLKFVIAAYKRGGWAELDRIHRNPPTTTAEILHPELYPLKTVAIASPVREHPLMDSALGEFHWRFLLGKEASAGWAGDRVTVVSGANGTLTVLGETRWASPARAAAFAGKLKSFLEGKHITPRMVTSGTSVRFAYGPDARSIESFLPAAKSK
ncbi:MAG: hypothetical protein ABI718_05200 [Acidobacteriota bacterium]